MLGNLAKRTLAWLTGSGAADSEQDAENVARDAFAREVQANLLDREPSLQLRYEPEAFLLVVTQVYGEPCESRIWLDNIYQDCARATVSERKEAMHSFVETAVQVAGLSQSADTQTFSDARDTLLPLVRGAYDHVYLLHHLHVECGQAFDTHSALPSATEGVLGESIQVQLGLDSAHSISRVSASQLKDWGVTFDHALAVATDNLRKLSAQPQWRNMQNGVFVAYWEDSYDSSRLLLTEALRLLDIQGAPVAFVPSREVLIVAGAADKEALRDAAMLALEVYQDATRPVSIEPLILQSDNTWQTFIAWEGWQCEVAEQLSHALKEMRKSAYDAQKALMEAQQEAGVWDVQAYVSDCMMFQRKDDTLFSIAAWSDHVESLLPQADYVMLRRTNPDDTSDTLDEVTLPWSKAEELLKPYWQRTADTPPRFHTTGFPNEEQFKALKMYAQEP